MLSKKLYLYSILLLAVLLSCSGDPTPKLVILSCVDENGNELDEWVDVTVDGETQTWAPGEALAFDLNMDVDEGYVWVEAELPGYELVSPNEYLVQKDQGLELNLRFAESTPESLVEEEVILPPDDVAPPVDSSTNPVDVRINIDPSNASVSIRSVSGGSSPLSFSGSSTIQLQPGTYRYTASLDGFEEQSENFTVRDDQPNVVGIAMAEIPPEDGYLSILVDPANAQVTLLNRETNQEYNVSASTNESIALRPGLYDYRIEAPNYNPVESSLRIRESEESELFETLISRSANEMIEQARNVETIDQAERYYLAWSDMNELPAMDANTRLELINEATDVAMVLFEQGQAAFARQFFEDLYQMAPENVQLRLLYAPILTRNGEYDKSRDLLRDIFGQLQNLIPTEIRSETLYQARFRYADTFYSEFQSIDQYDYDRRASVGAAAIAEFENVIYSYDETPELHPDVQGHETYEQLNLQAEDKLNFIARDLGF
jgi:hypothetical protein